MTLLALLNMSPDCMINSRFPNNTSNNEKAENSFFFFFLFFLKVYHLALKVFTQLNHLLQLSKTKTISYCYVLLSLLIFIVVQILLHGHGISHLVLQSV